ncbi:unnamed protein product [Linum trigynum]|uniref:Retrotransposon gag domain-containing protein n=1 Tax=Linum trigynum TaxID=586398 RepID=A0AAV2FNC3_9ROSI
MLQSAVQFNGMITEDAHAHIKSLYEVTDEIKVNRVPQEAIRLRLFPFTLNGAAKQWLNNHPHHSIDSWDDLCNKLFETYIPSSKMALMRSEITMFRQEEDEPMFEAWESFTSRLLKCPHHGIADWLQVESFYNGLTWESRHLIDAASGGVIRNNEVSEL